ncbi:hypothetical protein [Streptomyces antibioticus]|uniref:hypothetical protein n=1 Tax=Streptomyces antibioticus TaxID=1890 RepID=UPI0033F49E35
MHRFTVDYRKDETERRSVLLNKGYFLSGLPRLIPLCHLFGHRPVVDGYDSKHSSDHARWVCCDRCGVRPDPQGQLDADRWNLGDRYTGSMTGSWTPGVSSRNIEDYRPAKPSSTPGPWPAKPVGDVGAQVIIGKSSPGWDAELKIGNAGSEHTLAAHLRLYPFGAIYLHTERFGTWLQRRLNPTGYQSRIISIGMQHGGVDWKLWAKRDEWSKSDPWWMRGTIKLDPRDRLFGRNRYDYENVGAPVTATVRMPHGDDHEVRLQLQRCTDGRNRRRFHSWTVDWSTRPGIPTKPHGGEVLGSAVDVSARSVTGGAWPAEAAAQIAAQMTKDRTRYGFRLPAVVDGSDFDVEVD